MPARFSVAALCAALLTSAGLLVPVAPADAAGTCPTVIAHRGDTYQLSGPTESSIDAFTAAFDAGVTWVETDVQFTSDGVPVLMHDDTVNRTTTGTGYVSRMTAAQFTALTMRDGQHPPTLAQAIDLVRGHPERHLIMEFKAGTQAGEATLVSMLSGLENQVFVNAFAAHLANIQRMKLADPLLTISLITYAPVFPVPTGLSGEDMGTSYVTAQNVAQLHAAGLTARAWVPESTSYWRSLQGMGVDAIMTDNSVAYVAWALAECGGPVDQSPPTVTASGPEDGATVSGTIDVTGVAVDDVGVESVVLLVDGAVAASTAPGPEGQVALSWNSSSVSNGSHTLQLRARDRSGNLGSSTPTSVTVDNADDEAPSAPTAPTGSWSGPGHVSLAWGAASDNAVVTGYRVYRDGVAVADLGATALGYEDTSATDGATYTYRVTALDAAGHESEPSVAVTVATGDSTAPTAPTGLARSVSGFSVRLTWQPSTDNAGVTGYTVYRAGVAIGTTTGATAYTDSTVVPGKTYSYTVRARDAVGNLSAASTAVSATLPADRTAPSAPTTLKVVAGAAGSRQLTLTWGAATDNAGVASYYVYRGNSKYKLLGKVLTFVDTGLKAGTKYTYKVYAIDTSGNWSSPTANVSAVAR